MKKYIWFCLAVLLAAPACYAQAQKQINLGGGFVLNTKMPLADNAAPVLNDLFPIQMDKASFFKLPPAPEPAPQTQPAAKEQVHTICGEWVEKSERLVSVYKGRDWYIEKGSACAQHYYSGWKQQQDLSFIPAAQKRARCEQEMKQYPVSSKHHTCAVCGQPIDGRCGAVASYYDEDGAKHYAHSDCRAKARFEAKSAQLRNLLGLENKPAGPALPAPAGVSLSRQAKSQTLAELKKISLPSFNPKTPVVRPVSKAELDAFISQNGAALNQAAHKYRQGATITQQEQALLNSFEYLRQGYNNPQQAVYVPGNAVPSLRQRKTFQADVMAPRPQAQKPLPAAVEAASPVNAKQMPLPDAKPASARPQTKRGGVEPALPITAHAARPADGKLYSVVTKKMLKDFERANKKDMALIRVLSTSGAASDPQLEAKAKVYRILTESYQYLQTPQGKKALQNLKKFEKQHQSQMLLIRQWAQYNPQEAPQDLKPQVQAYIQLMQAGHLKP